MPGFETKNVLLLLQRMVYLAMLVLGFYFIYQGGVVQRFLLKRTNFAIHEAPFTELPTIVIWIYPMNASFGEDFKLYFSSIAGSDNEGFDDKTLAPTNEIELAFGENLQRVYDFELKVDFKRLYQGFSALNDFPNSFKITPTVRNLPGFLLESKDNMGFNLRLSFTNPHKMPGKQFRLYLSTENNTASCKGKHFDGDVDSVKEEELERHNKVTFFAKKYSYLKETNNCRQRPYTELLAENMYKNINTKCALPCKPKGSLEYCPALHLSHFIDELPVCQDKNFTCFDEAFENTLKSLSSLFWPLH